VINATNFKVCISFGFKKSMWASLAISLFSQCLSGKKLNPMNHL
jgi:hypothetical protein